MPTLQHPPALQSQDSPRPCPPHSLSEAFPHFSPRSCTDVICCVLFLLFILGYIVVGIVGEFPAAQSWGGGWKAITQGGTIPMAAPYSPCPSPLVILLCVSVSSLGVWRPPASPLPQELYWGLLWHRGEQVSMGEGQVR